MDKKEKISNNSKYYRPPPGYINSELESVNFEEDMCSSENSNTITKLPSTEHNVSIQRGEIEPRNIKNIRLKYLNTLRMKQFMMDAFIRRLLYSLNDLQNKEKDSSKSNYIFKIRSLKLTRIVQILLNQKKNLYFQTTSLQNEIEMLDQKHEEVCNRLIELAKHNNIFKSIVNSLLKKNYAKDEQLKNLSNNLSLLDKQTHKFNNLVSQKQIIEEQLECLVSENEHLKQSLRDITASIKKDKDNRYSFNNSIFSTTTQRDVNRKNLQLVRIRARNQQLYDENRNLKQLLNQYKENCAKLNNKKDNISFEELQKRYLKLQQVLAIECENRKMLHGQLREFKGNIEVICRCRPLNPDKQSSLTFFSCDRLIISQNLEVESPDNESLESMKKDKVFLFNRVLDRNSKQSDVFEEIQSLITSCVDGYNVCLLTYGPSSSGKSYTMHGVPENPGVGLLAITELFELCNLLDDDWEKHISISMFEIYNENIYDLFDKNLKLIKLSDYGKDVFLIDAIKNQVSNEDEMLQFIQKGHRNQQHVLEKLNVEFSRSHHIIKINLDFKNRSKLTKRQSSLILCDLVGSECAPYCKTTNVVPTEAHYINKSLVALERVFEALKHQSNAKATLSKPAVPYRDSKLTHLLKPCLEGQSQCAIIITVIGELDSIERDTRALEFGSKAMGISLGTAPINKSILDIKLANSAESEHAAKKTDE